MNGAVRDRKSGFPDRYDGLVKVPTPSLRCSLQSFNGRWLPFMTPKFAPLEFERFTRPSKSDFLRVNQILFLKFSLKVERINNL